MSSAPDDGRRHSPAFPRNREPIAAAVRDALAGAQRVLEIASGPGQHAFDYVEVLPGAVVQPSDREPAAVRSIDAWRKELAQPRVLPARLVDVKDRSSWPTERYDAVVAVNFLHMVPLDVVGLFFELAGSVLPPGGKVWVYDCFTYEGEHIGPNNAAFSARLAERGGGVWAIEDCDQLAATHGLGEREVAWLPANNQGVSWRRLP